MKFRAKRLGTEANRGGRLVARRDSNRIQSSHFDSLELSHKSITGIVAGNCSTHRALRNNKKTMPCNAEGNGRQQN